ncbi:hypothetical protein C9374_007482 [Naegleria lovaniensis]|uniref:Uncharacterized protein n=1 Tax=Naegleria lovaniensis TaxID=51637 RepID=A0AA88GN46_NAELO|nr:uncharacterized protein C9374_007482 [Naegleria lovaniensis]KAG2379343.1 hypothetical protein C9374_007482 [Naegleria lovaniensis]
MITMMMNNSNNTSGNIIPTTTTSTAMNNNNNNSLSEMMSLNSSSDKLGIMLNKDISNNINNNNTYHSTMMETDSTIPPHFNHNNSNNNQHISSIPSPNIEGTFINPNNSSNLTQQFQQPPQEMEAFPLNSLGKTPSPNFHSSAPSLLNNNKPVLGGMTQSQATTVINTHANKNPSIMGHTQLPSMVGNTFMAQQQQHHSLSEHTYQHASQQHLQNSNDGLPSLQQFGLLFSHSLNAHPSNIHGSSSVTSEHMSPLHKQHLVPTTNNIIASSIHNENNGNSQLKFASPPTPTPNSLHTSPILNLLVQSQQTTESQQPSNSTKHQQRNAFASSPPSVATLKNVSNISMPSHQHFPHSSATSNTIRSVNQQQFTTNSPSPMNSTPTSLNSPEKLTNSFTLPSNPMIYEGLMKLVAHRIMECILAFDEKTSKNTEAKNRLQDEWNKLVNDYFIVGKRLEGLPQMLHCLYGMLTEESEVDIVRERLYEENNVPRYFSIDFKANLRLLRLKICIFFLLYRLSSGSCFQDTSSFEEFLDINSLSVNEKIFSSMSWEQFILEMDAIESKLRFRVDLVSHHESDESDDEDTGYVLSVKQNTMNNVKLKSVAEEKLSASFDQLLLEMGVVNSLNKPTQPKSYRLQLSVQMSNYLTITKYSNTIIDVSVDGVPSSRTIHDLSPLRIVSAERKNRVVVLHFSRDFFVTPTRDKSDIDFVIEFGKGNDRKRASAKSIYIDRLLVDFSSHTMYQHVSVYRGQEILCEELEITMLNNCVGTVNSGGLKLSIIAPTSLSEEPNSVSSNTSSVFSPGSTTPPFSEESPRSCKRAYSADDEKAGSSTCVSPSGSKRAKSGHNQNNMNMASISQYVKSFRDRCGFSLLHIAAMYGFNNAIEFLHEALSMSIDITDNYQYSPYHWSCFACKPSTAKLLISKGASTTRRNIHMATGIEIAAAKNHKQFVEELEFELEQHACSALFDLYAHVSESDNNNMAIQPQQQRPKVPNPPLEWSTPPTNDNIPQNLKIPSHNNKVKPMSVNTNLSNKNTESRSKKKPGENKISPTTAATTQLVSPPPTSGRKQTSSSKLTPSSSYNTDSPITVTLPSSSANSNPLSQRMELFIKPSRKKRTYISCFPKELCSSPYKYDILLRIPLNYTNQFNESNFTFHLMIQGADKNWTPVTEQAVDIVKYLRTMFPLNFREIEWRLMYKVCSFHYGRKPFKLRVIYNTNMNPATANPIHHEYLTQNSDGKVCLPDNTVVFESEEFYIVARKKKDSFHESSANGDLDTFSADQSPLTELQGQFSPASSSPSPLPLLHQLDSNSLSLSMLQTGSNNHHPWIQETASLSSQNHQMGNSTINTSMPTFQYVPNQTVLTPPSFPQLSMARSDEISK